MVGKNLFPELIKRSQTRAVNFLREYNGENAHSSLNGWRVPGTGEIRKNEQ